MNEADRLMDRARARKLRDGTFIARVAGRPGLIAFGDSESLALAELRSVVEDALRLKRGG